MDERDVLEVHRPSLVPHLGGGQHLDSFAGRPDLLHLVSGDDEQQYAPGGWATAELVTADACPPPSGRGPSQDAAFWLDDELAAGEQWAAYRYLADPAVHPGPVLQVGGRGVGLIRWMRATGRPGVLLSPFDSELDHCRALARAAGVVGDLLTVRAAAEQMPFEAGVIGTAFAPGVLHHTDVGATVRELVRTTAPDGRFATWDVWASPAYRAGISLLGKQEAIRCTPLDEARISQVPRDVAVTITWGGSPSRYPVAALARLGLRQRPARTARLGLLDRELCRRFPVLRTASASLVSLHGRGAAASDPSTAAPRQKGQVERTAL